jgi:hypothetical protein
MATPATAEDGSWTVVPPAKGVTSMSRTVENVTLTYKRSPDDDDHLHIAVGCGGGGPWEMDESLNGVTAETLRESITEEIDNAKLNCKLADGVEDRLLAGFDEAFAQVKPFAPPHTATIGGWQLADVGSMPGDDSERRLTASRTLGGLKVSYEPSADNGGGMVFECEGATYGTNFGFDDPAEDHSKAVSDQVTEAYADLAKECKPKPPAQAALMQDFPEALKTVEQWLAAKPFVYLPEPPSSDKEQ